ncbi:copper amine oxidase [Lophiotrema nucula]|uniref:Amine oxidase n=1 Tax=Lophiotrema nucula TaxID=690887 RepID=A0A6A5YF13_9PLEO|nr:copper amine oxidase [Lophiotrema nucula]
MKSFFPTFLLYASILKSAKPDTGWSQCSNEQPTIHAPHINLWSPLSSDELAAVTQTLQRHFNLSDTPGSRSNYIVQIDVLQPNKTDVSSFLGGFKEKPARHARATVAFGAPDIPYYQEYMIGPLSAANSSRVQPLTYPFNSNNPGKTNIAPLFIGQDAGPFVVKFSSEIEDITKYLWNTTLADGGVGLRIAIPFWEEEGQLIGWGGFTGSPTTDFDSTTLLPLGVFVRLNFVGRNYTEWDATGWYCQGKFYDSTKEFRAAVFSASFNKPQPNSDGPWTSTDRRGDPLPLDELPPPAQVSQGSKRFKVDEKENYVSWMDFGFFLTVASDTGLSLFDINYKGKRIIYELGLQEALTHYAGYDPWSSQTTFLDTVEGLGATLVPLVKGYDCPSYATYLNATYTQGASVVTQADTICIFESDPAYPIRRHAAVGRYVSVAKNTVFIVRTISTVGNYDFMIEYSFFLDGSVEVSVRASGYISATYWEGSEDYGFHIHDFLSGSMHDHVLTFKADFDILGEKNSVQKVEFVPETVQYPWARDPRNTMKALRSFITSESDSSIDWAPNDAALYSIVNKDTPNKYGEYPGYRIKRSAGASHLTVQNSTDVKNAAHFADHDLYITKQKDTEPRAADRNNQHNPSDPLVDFGKFLDGENLEQEDVVVWFNLGMHHIPHTGDLPNTMFTSAHSAVRFEPFNYLEDGDPSVASTQQLRLVYGEDGSVKEVKTFGAESANCSADLSMLGLVE